MWPKQASTFLLKAGIKIPLIQAPMAGGATTPGLVAAVSNAGGLGSLGAGNMKPDAIRKDIEAIRGLTQQPFNVNLFVPQPNQKPSAEEIQRMNDSLNSYRKELGIPLNPPLIMRPNFDEQLKVLIEEKVPVVSFTFGIPSKTTLKALKEKGTYVIGTATTVEEAQLLESSGCDAVVAQGSEAGGHRGTFPSSGFFKPPPLITTRDLLLTILSNIKMPVIAAGEIMNGDDLARVLKAGAVAGQMGTAFLCCDESGIHENQKKAIFASNEETILTQAFSGKPVRAINNLFIQEMEKHKDLFLRYPWQDSLTADIRKAAADQNRPEFMSLYVGEGYPQATLGKAATHVSDTAKDALHILSKEQKLSASQ